MAEISITDKDLNPLKGQNFEWCVWSYPFMEGETIQGMNINGVLGSSEWPDWLVRDLAEEKSEGWGPGGVGKRHVDRPMGVAIKCTLWVLENI